jgi:hypothetical protein
MPDVQALKLQLKLMQSYFIILLFLSLLPSAAFSQTKTERTLKQLERRRFEAMTKRDVAYLSQALADELTYTHSNGFVETKAEHLKNIETGALLYESMQAEQIQVRVIKKTAVLTGVVAVSGKLKDRAFNLRIRYTDVYVKKRGQWQLAAWQSLRLE